MTKGFFITGTDTEVGKSWCSAGIMEKLKQQGHRVIGMKPIASGCDETASGLRNEDALLLQQHASIAIDYELINPYRFKPAIAPHIAAEQANVSIKLGKILEHYLQLKAISDSVIVEGVGGWQVPLNEYESVADLAAALKLPVILIVGLRLGCINHALLSAEAIRTSGCTLYGWIANEMISGVADQGAVIDSIAQRIGAPLLGHVPWQNNLDATQIAETLTF